MAVRIRSLVNSTPVLVPLSTGTTLRLSPGQVSDLLPDVEVANNPKVEKLRRQGQIDVESAAPAATDSAGQPAEAPNQPGWRLGSRPAS
jgi:hypothetical protein